MFPRDIPTECNRTMQPVLQTMSRGVGDWHIEWRKEGKSTLNFQTGWWARGCSSSSQVLAVPHMQHSTDMQEAEGNRFYPEIKTEGKIAIPIAAITQLSIYAALVFSWVWKRNSMECDSWPGLLCGCSESQTPYNFLGFKKGVNFNSWELPSASLLTAFCLP